MLTHRSATILGNIPVDWERDLVKALLTEQQGGDWGDDSGGVGVRVLRSTNFTDRGILDFTDVAMRYFSRDKAQTLGLKQGSLLVERSGGGPTQPVGRIGFITEELPGFWFSNFVQLIVPDPTKVNPDFLAWILLQLNQTGIVERLQHQTTQMRNLDFRDYLRLYVPKPCSKEQEGIASVLRMANEAHATVEAKLTKARRLRTALLQKLFVGGVPGRHKQFSKTKWVEAPSCWKPRQLRDIADVEAGFTMGRDLSGYETVEVAYLTVINVQEGSFDLSDVEHVLVKTSELTDLILHWSRASPAPRRSDQQVYQQKMRRRFLPRCLRRPMKSSSPAGRSRSMLTWNCSGSLRRCLRSSSRQRGCTGRTKTL